MWLLVNVSAWDCDEIEKYSLNFFESKMDLDNHIKKELLRLMDDTMNTADMASYTDFKDPATNKHLEGKEEVEKRIMRITDWVNLTEKRISYTYEELDDTNVEVTYRPNSVQFLSSSNYHGLTENFVFIQVVSGEEQFITVKTELKVYTGYNRNSSIYRIDTVHASRDWFCKSLIQDIKEFTKDVNKVLAPIRKNYPNMMLKVSQVGKTLTDHDDLEKFVYDESYDGDMSLAIGRPMTNITTYVVGETQDRHCTTNYILLHLSL